MAPRNYDGIEAFVEKFESSSLEQTEEAILNNLDNRTDKDKYKSKIVWRNVAIFVFLHIGALYGIYLCFYAKYMTLLFAIFLHFCGAFGITAGAHRLWAHRTYKAKLPLRILLGIFQTIAVQNHIYEWSRDHRVHHKYSETDADPHNIKRGFFFAHIGWLLMKKHPEVTENGKKLYLKDLLDDPVVYWQRRFYKPLAILFCFILPTIIPVLCWDESIVIAYFVPAILRYICTLHSTWLVNSVAHLYGNKPYDKRINPVENIFVSINAVGEGFHNYHHTFPQDYSTSEYGFIYFNLTKGFIDLMAIFGQVYDRNKVSKDTVLKRRLRTGDLNHNLKIE